jgi:hypothetical protein
MDHTSPGDRARQMMSVLNESSEEPTDDAIIILLVSEDFHDIKHTAYN